MTTWRGQGRVTSVTKLTLINKLIPWVSQTEKEAGKPENRSNNLMDPVLALSQNQLDYKYITSFAINVWPLLNSCPPEQSRLIWISSVARESLWSVWLIKDPLVFVLGFVFANLCIFLLSKFRKGRLLHICPVGRLVGRLASPLIFFNIYRHTSLLLNQYHFIQALPIYTDIY